MFLTSTNLRTVALVSIKMESYILIDVPFGICVTSTILAFNLKIVKTFYFFCRTIRWYVTVEITFVRESIQGDEHITASFRTIPEIMADVSTYDPKELLIILFDHSAIFLPVGSGWRCDSVQNLTISLCPFRSTVGAGSYIETPKFLHSH